MEKLSNYAKFVNSKITLETITLDNYISTENMLSNKRGIKRSERLPNTKVTEFKVGDILLSNIRPYFKKIWYATFEGGCSGDVLVIRANIADDSKYLFYLLSTDEFFDYNIKGSKGTKMPRGDKQHIMNYAFELPSPPERKDLADILTSLDDKIELNNQMNQTLEEMANVLYKQWFIDFEFPNEDGKPYKSSGGKMFESELGLIPKGWEVKQLKDCINLVNGYAFKSSSYITDGKYKIVTIKNVLDGKFDMTTFNCIESKPANIGDGQILNIGDLLLSLTGNVGRLCRVTQENCLLNQRVAKIKPQKRDQEPFWSMFFLQSEVKNIMLNKAKGTAQANLSSREVLEINIAFSEDIINLFSTKISKILQLKLDKDIEVLNLENVKKNISNSIF